MTDSAIAGAATAGTLEGANAGAATNGSQAASAPDIFASLQDAESRQWVESKGYKDINTVVSDARYADKLKAEIGDLKSKALVPPANDAKPEDWDAYYARLGRPEKPEGYEFKLPEGLPQDLPYDGDAATAYKGWAHKYGLSPRQAQGMHDEFVRHQAGQFQSASQAMNQRQETAHAEIEKVWGDKSSDSYRANLQFADRFINQNGGEALMAELKANRLLADNGAVLSPKLAQAFAAAGKALYAEDRFVTGGQVQQAKSAAETLYPTDPFKR